MDILTELAKKIVEKDSEIERIKTIRDREIATLEQEIDDLWTEHFKEKVKLGYYDSI